MGGVNEYREICRVVNVVCGNATNSVQFGGTQLGGRAEGVEVVNVVYGDVTNSIQCGDVYGGINL